MTDVAHPAHPATSARPAHGHLRRVIQMIDDERTGLDLATQNHAIDRAVAEAKRALIRDPIDHCLTGAPLMTWLWSRP